MRAIKKLPPTIKPEEVKTRLAVLSQKVDEWTDEADIKLRRELNGIANELDKMRSLKRGGVSSLPSDVAEPLTQLLAILDEAGVFLVPVDELEGWLAEANIQESKEQKWAWANAAAVHVQAAGANKGGMWHFMRGVGHFLQA